MTIAILKNICYTPYYRKLTLHEINPDFKNSRLIMSFIFVYVDFRDLKVARYSFSGSIPPKFERKLRRHLQRFGEINTNVVLDKDETLL